MIDVLSRKLLGTCSPRKVFVSYRTSDSLDLSARIADDLRRRLGDESVFFSTDSIECATKWPDALRLAAESADVVIAVIGPTWLNPENAARLRDPSDWVRNEILIGLRRKRLVIIRCGGAQEINASTIQAAGLSELSEIAELQQSIQIRSDPHYHSQIDEIVLLLQRFSGVAGANLSRISTACQQIVSLCICMLPVQLPGALTQMAFSRNGAISFGQLRSRRSFSDAAACCVLAKNVLFVLLLSFVSVFLFTPWIGREREISSIVAHYDARCFSPGATLRGPAIYDVCRGIPSSLALKEETNLKQTIRETKYTFDILVLQGGVFEAFREDFEDAIARGVKLRIIQTDHTRQNWPNIAPYYGFMPSDNPDQKWRQGLAGVQRHLDRLKELGESRGNVEIRQVRGPYLHSMWVSDSKETASGNAVAHLAVPFRGERGVADSSQGEIVVRFGHLSPRMVSSVATEFENVWRKCAAWDPDAHLWQ